jgi:regulator of sigma E protease
MNYFAALLIIGGLILLHEAGHFLAARAAGIPVNLFSIGFGPALWKKKIGATEYRVSLIPLGGYVLPAVSDENDYFRIPVYKRIILSLGGPAANLAAVLILYAILNTWQTGFSAAGIFITPVIQTVSLLQKILASLAGLFTLHNNIYGILGVVHQGGAFITGGAANALRLALILSANLAVFNLLPLPVLDGGKILFCLMEKISVRLRAAYMPMMVIGWLFIIGLMIYATVMDAARLLSSYA